jgi:hypothetical protein
MDMQIASTHIMKLPIPVLMPYNSKPSTTMLDADAYDIGKTANSSKHQLNTRE